MLILGAVAAAVAPAHPFTVEDMHRISRIAEVRVSPDGKLIAFTATTSDVKKNAYVRNVWLAGIDGSNVRPFTHLTTGSASQPRWGTDSQTIYYTTADKHHHAQIFRRTISGGTAIAVTDVSVGVGSYLVSRDGKTIAFTATVYPQCSSLACDAQTEETNQKQIVKVRLISDIPFRRWDEWTEGKRIHLFVVPASGGQPRDLTPGDADSPVWSERGADVDVSPDGKELVFARYTSNESLTFNSNLFSISTAGGTPKQLTSTLGSVSDPQYSPDGRYIAYIATARSSAEADTPHLYLYNRQAGTSTEVTASWDHEIAECKWARDSEHLWCSAQNRGMVGLYSVDISAKAVTPAKIDGTNGSIDAAEGTVVFTHADFDHPAEIYRLNDAAADPEQITSLNAGVLKGIEFGATSSFTFAGWHGDPIQAWEIKPPGFDPSKKYPLLLLMHGGPHGSWNDEFHYRWNAQLFAAAGYVVIEPNFHGSTGFGTPFMDAIKGQWGGAPYEDQMKAVDVALSWPYVDATRVSAAGASYGGYMANWVEGHTDRFRSIVSHDGLYDVLTAQYSTDFIGWAEADLKSTPWRNPDALVAQSPAYYAKNFKTPMLLIHGGRDYRVDLSNGIAMFQLLQAMHVPSKLLVFEEENHWTTKPADSIFWYHSVLDWLDRWSKPDTAQYRKMLSR